MPQRKRARRRPYRVFRVESWEAFLQHITQSAVFELGVSRRARRALAALQFPLALPAKFRRGARGLAGAGAAHPADFQTQGAPVPGQASRSSTMISTGWR